MPRRIVGLPLAIAVVAAALAESIRPAPAMTVSEWSEQHRVVPEPSVAAGKWRNSTAPFLVEIMDFGSPSDARNYGTVLKAAQVGVSEVLANVVMAWIDLAPTAILIAHPTSDGVKAWDAEKFDPAIKATAQVARKIRPVSDRDRQGSTARYKRFPGGYVLLIGANSEADLRQHSMRLGIKDDWSGWPLKLQSGGDPDRMFEARFDSYRKRGNFKVLQASTPTLTKTCRTWKAWLRSDQRRWVMDCPHCGNGQDLHFFADKDGKGGLRFNDAAPFEARYACEACGALIEEGQRRAMAATGRWVPTNPKGDHPGWHIPKLISLLEPWDELARKWTEADGDPEAEQAFYNLDLGLPWEEKGDAPEWESLKTRAEPYSIGTIPLGAWLLTIGADVQETSIYWEAVAWGPGRESWSVASGQIIGATAEDPLTGAIWREMDMLYERRWPMARGESIGVDMLAIDAGHNGDQVCGWVARKPHAMAVKGVGGWDHAVYGRRPTREGTTARGKIERRGARIWPVYVWSLKGQFYANLRKVPTSDGWPPGSCHFPVGYDDTFYQQLTADHLHAQESKGQVLYEWRTKGENHFHDCRIYAMAARWRAEQMNGVQFGDPASWARLITRRGGAPAQGELMLDAMSGAAAAIGIAPIESAPASEAGHVALPVTDPSPASRVVPFAQRRIVRNSLVRG
ncbi:MAG: phage terminase large subunit family protein [Alphaproteobacteria bacterium]